MANEAERDVPQRTDLASPFVFEWVRAHAARNPRAPAVGTPEGWLDYGALWERVATLASHLVARGLRPEDRVVIALPNLPAAVVASLAVQAAGATAVEVNRESGPDALAAILAETEARQVIALGRDAATWQALGRQHALEDLWLVPPVAAAVPHTLLAEDGALGEALPFEPRARPEGVASIVYTSGSTGRPRGVLQTHRNIAANSRSIVEYLALTAADRALSILPLFYCFGKSVLQTHLLAGGSVYFDHRFAFPRVVLDAGAEQRCTGFYGVPLTFELVKRHIDPAELPRLSLRYVAQAGGAMHPETVRWVRAAFAPAELFVMYGQTEATARLSYLPPERALDKAGSIGRGIPGVTLEVRDEQGQLQPAGQVGELWARGENVTPGYFRDAVGTAQILREGWLRTGDLGYRDADGFIFITGRARQFLKIGGHRVSALEIEQSLAAHPDVLETAVVGMGDPLGGEAAAAFVVLRSGSSLTERELRTFCRKTMPAWKVPKGVMFVAQLPRTGAGKIATRVLEALLQPAEVRTPSEDSPRDTA
jgi:long-chain acyl-CoA synthetase